MVAEVGSKPVGSKVVRNVRVTLAGWPSACCRIRCELALFGPQGLGRGGFITTADAPPLSTTV